MQNRPITATPTKGFRNLTAVNVTVDHPRMRLILDAPNTADNRRYVNALKRDLEQWGKEIPVTTTDDSLTMEVIGKDAICEMILHLKEKDIYDIRANDALYGDLIQWYATNSTAKARPMPTRVADLSRFTLSDDEDHSTANASVAAIKNNPKKDPATQYIYKKFTKKRKISEVESFSAALFRLTLGPDRASHIKDTNRNGVLIQKISAFTDGLATRKSDDELINSGFVEMSVASYVFEETDLHEGNWGVDESGNVVRIDFDGSLWPLTSKYKGFAPKKHEPFPLTTSPEQAFVVSSQDLIQFPLLLNATPQQWLMHTERFKEKPAFIERKWAAFLKHILLHQQPVLTDIAGAYFGSEKARQKYRDHVNQRLASIKTRLMELPEFVEYIQSHPTIVDKITEEFNLYNERTKDLALRVNLPAIRDAFLRIREEAAHTNLDLNAHNQSLFLHATQSLNAMINTADAFRYDYDSTINELEAALQSVRVRRNPVLFNRMRNELEIYKNDAEYRKEEFTAILDKAREVIRTVNALKESQPQDIKNLTNILVLTADLIGAKIRHAYDPKVSPLKKDLEEKIEHYNIIANQTFGQPSLAYKLLGSAMVMLGAVICAAGTLIATATLIPTLGLGALGGAGISAAGGTLLLSGIGLFTHGRVKGLAKEMTELKQSVRSIQR